jgi:hypothetical protein
MRYNMASAGDGQIGRTRHDSSRKIPAARYAAGIFLQGMFDQ